VLQALIDELKLLGAEAQDTNLKHDRIRQALRDRPTVIILDEIDRPMPTQREATIYGLLNLPKTGLICIASSTRALGMLDERIRSRLSPAIISSPGYSTKQLEEILTDRARQALLLGAWSSGLIKRIAHCARGDARLAIQILRQTAAATEQAGQTAVSPRSVDDCGHQWTALHHQARLATLSKHEKIIEELVQTHGPIGSTQLKQRYAAYCRKRDIRPMARRTFSKYLARLHAARILDVSARSLGHGGRLVRGVQA